ncbi:MAG: type II toxin-antitoxin system VapC family toxin [Bifidobacteriaceae bacterium]|nr:type II toxin-antitoxin system VapC family toxin [Bifidobacteriaceae bacterium]
MSAAYLLETDTAIERRRRSSRPDWVRITAAEGSLAVSSTSVAELEHGSLRSSDPAASRRAVNFLLTVVQVAGFDRPAAEQASRVRAELAANGTPIGAHDTVVAQEVVARRD